MDERSVSFTRSGCGICSGSRRSTCWLARDLRLSISTPGSIRARSVPSIRESCCSLPERGCPVNTSTGPGVLPVSCGVTDLARLVQAAQGGDRPAFGELYQRYARFVHGIVLSRVPRADVQDLVQDIFVAAMQRLG